MNLNSLSKRAQDCWRHPKYLIPNLAEDFFIEFGSDDKILTIGHSAASAGPIEFVFQEALAHFSLNRTLVELWKINWREIESFLRDENHLPAFANSLYTTPQLESIFSRLKVSLIATGMREQMKDELPFLLLQVERWENLSLAARNSWANILIKKTGAELIFCDQFTMTLAHLPMGVPAVMWEHFFQTVLGLNEEDFPVKVKGLDNETPPTFLEK